MGPNYVLDKGFVYSGGAAYSRYRGVKFVTETTVVVAAAITDRIIGVGQFSIDAADSATGNVSLDVRILGITKWEAAQNNIALGAFVAPAADGRAQTAVTTQWTAGMAWQASAAIGEWIDVLLLPGAFSIAKA